MREILFRGQTRKKGEKVSLDGTPVDSNWVYGGVAQFNEERAIIYQTEPEFHKFAVYAETLGQFTGLTDKNGNKIFEGDILESDSERFVVDWDDEFSGFYLTNVNPRYQGVAMFANVADDGYIIGNVHDNPELLKDDTLSEKLKEFYEKKKAITERLRKDNELFEMVKESD